MKFYNDVYFELIERNFGCILEYVNYANMDVETFLNNFCQSTICKEIENGNHIYIDTSALTVLTKACAEAKDFYDKNEQPIIVENIFFKAGQVLVNIQRELQISFSDVLKKISLEQIMEEIENASFYNKEKIANNIALKLQK